MLRESVEWIPTEMEPMGSARDMESHQMQRRWALRGGGAKGRVILSTGPPAGPRPTDRCL